jgi:hypothetical protein
MKSKHFAVVAVPDAEVVVRSNSRNEMILLTSYPTRGDASPDKSFGDNSSAGGGGCTDVWRFHKSETLRKSAEHTYALFVLVGINRDCEPRALSGLRPT